MWSILVAFLVCSAGASLIEVPQLDGSFKLMSPSELEDIENEGSLLYDPYTDIDFHLYTPNNPNDSQIIAIGDIDALQRSSFNPQAPTIIIIHGWGGDIRDGTIQWLRREYLAKGSYNIIGVDWSKGGSTPNYATARYRVAETGFAIADLILFLVNTTGARPSTFLPIGFSLGGQVVGFIGRGVRVGLGVKLERLISLDPAGVLFDFDSWFERINTDDAQLVEVTHTNGGALGMHAPLGHIDFYVNGGKIQHGCGTLDPGCSHTR